MCTNCNDSYPQNVYNVQFAEVNNCGASVADCPGGLHSTKCSFYSGPNLTCSGVATNDSLEVALQKLDDAVCANQGDYSTYNKHCLDAYFGSPITSEAEFVNAITAYTCANKVAYDAFVGTTFPAYQASVTADLLALEVPLITCAFAGVTDADSLVDVLNKYCTAFSTLNTAMDISTVDWDQCFTVVTPPTTIAAGFDLLVDQICELKASTPAALPVFNNTGSCLPTPGSADTLEDTVNKIKTRLCQTGTFDINALTWGNLTKPSSTTTNLQAAFQTVLTDLSVVKALLPTSWSADFVVTATNPSDPAAGVTVTLATPINQDRFVAATSGDVTPGTLQDKLFAGTNVTLDYVTNAGKVTINAPTNVATTNTYSIVFSGNGSSGSHLSANIPISATAGNALSINPDGLFAAVSSPSALSFLETSTTSTTVATNDVSINVKIDASQPGNILQYSANGLYVINPNVTPTVVAGASSSSATNTVALSAPNTYTVSTAVRISATVGNIITVESDGLYASVAAASYTFSTGLTEAAGVVTVNTVQNIGRLSNLATNGLVKTTSSNGTLAIAVAGTDYQAPISASNGLTYSANNVALGGTLTANTTITGGAYYMAFLGSIATLNQSNTPFSAASTVTSVGTETAQYIMSGVSGALVINNATTFTPYSSSKHGAVSGSVYKNSAGNWAGPLTAIYGCVEVAGAGDVTTAIALRAFRPMLTTGQTFSGTITNAVGLYIDDISSSTVNSDITNRYSIFQEGASDINLLNGYLRMVNLPVYADNTAAAALATGTFYRTSTGVVMVKY